MTMELTGTDQANTDLSGTTDTETVVWMSPAKGLWVASLANDYLGLIERLDGHYAVSDERGEHIGVFDDLASAQVALEPGSELNTQAKEDRRERFMQRVTLTVIAASAIAMAFLLGGIMQ